MMAEEVVEVVEVVVVEQMNGVAPEAVGMR